MDHAGKRITVMGLGRFGGGVGVTRFLAQRGARVIVTDKEPAEAMQASIAQLNGLGEVTFKLGGHDERDFTDADLVVANPAVRPDHPLLQAARNRGVPITTEITILVQHLPNRMRTIGITGTAGKSTTTAMIGHLLRKSEVRGAACFTSDFLLPTCHFNVHVGGNLGGSLLPIVDTITEHDWVVLELSSFMLHYLREIEWSPHIAVVTNLSPNHLDWHGTIEAYAAAKRGIVEHQQPGDIAVLGDGLDESFPSAAGAKLIASVDRSIDVLTPLPGGHNLVNAQAAVTAVCKAGMSIDPQQDLLDFNGLPHRLQYVGSTCEVGVRCFNDSKSTTPEAAMLAIGAFTPETVHIILGGYDKGSDLTKLAEHAAQQCAGVYTIGVTGDRIADAAERVCSDAVRPESCGGVSWDHGAHVQRSGTLETAVRQALQRATAGQVVVLSPGCASWDQFENYEQRGERFVELCRQAGVK
jgi:UDP-N-acetylmuramoylalanine--D-glutamate ligase